MSAARALVITTDVARPIPHTYAEPSQGAAAIAMLVGPEPRLLELESCAGSYGYEVMDSCRPTPDIETGDPDLSLLSYLDCIRGSFADYRAQAEAARGVAPDFRDGPRGVPRRCSQSPCSPALASRGRS